MCSRGVFVFQDREGSWRGELGLLKAHAFLRLNCMARQMRHALPSLSHPTRLPCILLPTTTHHPSHITDLHFVPRAAALPPLGYRLLPHH